MVKISSSHKMRLSSGMARTAIRRKATAKQRATMFKPGQSGNPGGRPKGCKDRYSILQLFKALDRVEEKKRQKLLEKYCERAFTDKDPRVLLHLIDRFLPAMRSVDLTGSVLLNEMDQETAAVISERFKDRFTQVQKMNGCKKR